MNTTIIKNIHQALLDIIFPIKCISCQKEGAWLCKTCISKIRFQTEHVCGVCEIVITPDGRTCHSCKKKNNLDGFLPATSYKEPSISHAVHLFKYRFIQGLELELGNILTSAIQRTDLPIPDIILPVPLHPRRLRWRGFNQSSLLASHIAKNLLPLGEIDLAEHVLVRQRYTHPQMEIKKHSLRKQNLLGAFAVIDREKVAGKIVLLVDDIATTGSTIFECANVLKAAGAKEIYAAVIARQEIKNNDS